MSSALDIVLVGKYHGCTHAAVAEADRSYCAWVASAASLPRSLLPFKMWLKRTHGGVLPYGKYKNRFPVVVNSWVQFAYAAHMRRMSYAHTVAEPD